MPVKNFANSKNVYKALAKKLDLSVGEIVENLGVEAYKNVTALTPVDTGYARASWNISQVSPDESIEDKKKFSGEGIQIAKAVNNRKLSSFTYDINSSPAVFVTNNVPYIVELENGHSEQSKYMVRRTLHALRRKYIKILKL